MATIGKLTNVPAPGMPITSPWAVDVSKLSVHVFATLAALQAQWADAPLGATAYVSDEQRYFTATSAGPPAVWTPFPRQYANRAALDAGWSTAPNGSTASTTTPSTTWIRRAGTWVPQGGVLPSIVVPKAIQAVPSAAWTVLTWSAPTLQNFFAAPSGNEILIPFDGIYTVTANVRFAPHATGWRIAQISNEGGYIIATGTAPSMGVSYGTEMTLAVTFQFVATSRLKVSVHQDSGAPLSILPGDGISIGSNITLIYHGPAS
jgi:hypothetical protein